MGSGGPGCTQATGIQLGEGGHLLPMDVTFPAELSKDSLASFFYSMFLIHGCGVLVLFWFVFFLCLFFSSMTLTRQRGV